MCGKKVKRPTSVKWQKSKYYDHTVITSEKNRRNIENQKQLTRCVNI